MLKNILFLGFGFERTSMIVEEGEAIAINVGFLEGTPFTLVPVQIYLIYNNASKSFRLEKV